MRVVQWDISIRPANARSNRHLYRSIVTITYTNTATQTPGSFVDSHFDLRISSRRRLLLRWQCRWNFSPQQEGQPVVLPPGYQGTLKILTANEVGDGVAPISRSAKLRRSNHLAGLESSFEAILHLGGRLERRRQES